MPTNVPKGVTLNDSGLLVREFAVRSADAEAREFTGVGVPYGVEIEHMFGREMFDAGSIEDAESARILWQHREPIGRVIAHEETPDGLKITGKISATDRGNEAMTLLKDGVIRSLSIGFEPIEFRVENPGADDELIHWTRVRAREFSLVTFPAYDAAEISGVRSKPTTTPRPEEKETPMGTETPELEAITSQLADMNRRMELMGTGHATAAAPEWRSMGEFLKAIASGNDDAIEFHRAYTGATTADTIMKDSFVGDFIRLVEERRRIVNLFTRGTLPADGLSVDYYQLDTDSTDVAKQATEGADLPYGKVTLKKANSPVDTYGGWTELTRQAIERATVPALNVTLRALALTYARVTNQATASTFATIVTENLAAFNDVGAPVTTAGVQLAAATADGWLDVVIDGAMNFETKGYQTAGLLVSPEVFKTLSHLKDGDRRLMGVYGQGVNQIGSMDIPGLTGALASVKVSMLPGITGQVAAFYDPVAIETLESAGAPAQLQDENIINLSKQFSLYGYNAIITPFKDAVLPVDFA